jgi:hypothetical protein
MDSSPARFTNPAYGRLGKPYQQVKKYQNFYNFYHFISKQKLFWKQYAAFIYAEVLLLNGLHERIFFLYFRTFLGLLNG